MGNSSSGEIYKIKDLLHLKDRPADLFIRAASSSLEDLFGGLVVVSGTSNSGKTTLSLSVLALFSKLGHDAAFCYFGSYPFYTNPVIDSLSSNKSKISFVCLSKSNVVNAIEQLCSAGVKAIVLDDLSSAYGSNDLRKNLKVIEEILRRYNAVLFLTFSLRTTEVLGGSALPSGVLFISSVVSVIKCDANGCISVRFTKNRKNPSSELGKEFFLGKLIKG